MAKWCGHTSAVTLTPSSFAFLTIVTLSFVEQWHKCNLAPVSFASKISLATIISSTALLIPLTPNSSDLSPIFITPPFTKLISSQWANTGTSALTAFFIASRYTLESITDLPSSLIAHIPASLSSNTSVISFPAIPLVTEPTGSTFVYPASFPLFIIYLTTSALSVTGFVFGMQHTDVNPPLAAAILPVIISSL